MKPWHIALLVALGAAWWVRKKKQEVTAAAELGGGLAGVGGNLVDAGKGLLGAFGIGKSASDVLDDLEGMECPDGTAAYFDPTYGRTCEPTG